MRLAKYLQVRTNITNANRLVEFFSNCIQEGNRTKSDIKKTSVMCRKHFLIFTHVLRTLSTQEPKENMVLKIHCG